MELISVAAVSENGVIGLNDELPWPSIEADKKQYRDLVSASPVVLGRRSFGMMLEDLPGRTQIVLSRTERDYDVDTAHHADGVEAAIEVGESMDADEIYVLGGGGIYELFQPHVDRMVLSRVEGTYEGDSYYPEFDPDDWILESETAYDRFTLEEWTRRDAGD